MRHLPGQKPATQEVARPVGVPDRDVRGLAGRGRDAHPHQLAAHRIERGRLGVDGDRARRARVRQPRLQPVEAGDGLVGGAIERRRGGGLGCLGRARRRPGRPRRGLGDPLVAGVEIGPQQRPFGDGVLGDRRVRRNRHDHLVRPGRDPCRRFGRYQLRVGLDGLHGDAGRLGDALGERAELQRLREGQHPLRIGRRDRERRERHVGADVAVERDQPLRQPRLVGVGRQELPSLRLLDLGRAREKRFEVAVLLDQRRRGLDADARDARHVVRRVADQRLDVDHLLRRHAEVLDDPRLVDPPLRPVAGLPLGARLEVVEADVRADQLHQVLVGRDDQHVRPGVACLASVGGDDVVGLVARLVDRDEREGAHGLPHQRELRLQVVRRLAAVRLVVGIHFLAERLLRPVEDDGEVRRHDADRAFIHELVDLGREQPDRAGRQPVRAMVVLHVLVHGLEVRAVDERRAVDQEDMVAGFDGTVGQRGLGHAPT